MSTQQFLYLALFQRIGLAVEPDGVDRFYWALIRGPEDDECYEGLMYNGRLVVRLGTQTPSELAWEVKETEITQSTKEGILVRLVLAAIKDPERLHDQLVSVPAELHAPEVSNFLWVKAALASLEEDGLALGERQVQWDAVKTKAVDYCDEKIRENRFQEGYDEEAEPVPTWNMVEDQEVVA